MTPTDVFSEGSVEADGGRLRYLDGGRGDPLVHLPGAGEARLTPAHALLARHFRVVVFETPAPAATLARAATTLGLDTFNLMGTSRGATAALALALEAPHRVRALVLEAPAAIRPDARDPEFERRLAGLATPTLVLLGTADAVVPSAMGRVYKELIPGCHLVFVYAAGHAIGAERPEAFADVTADFLERREAFVISRTATVIHP